MNAEIRAESEPVFRHIRGICQRVASFDCYGHAEIVFRIRKGRYKGMHSVAIEPYLLLVQHERRGA